MSLLLLDSNILIEHLRNRPKAVGFINKAVKSGETLASSVICRAEILNGLLPGEEDITLGFLDRFRWLPVTVAITDHSSAIYRRFHASHGVDFFDSLVAATAKAHDCILYTLDRKHYPMKDIRVASPY